MDLLTLRMQRERLDTTDHTLTGKGIEYVADVTHMNTWRELAKKLPMFLTAKWTECTGKIIDSGRRPKFEDLTKFITERAKLMENECGQDMNETRDRLTFEKKVISDETLPQLQTFATGSGLSSGVQSAPSCLSSFLRVTRSLEV